MRPALPLAVALLAAATALAPFASAQAPATITATSRLVEADATFVDAVFFDPVHDFESFGSLLDGAFDAFVDADASSFGSSSYSTAEQVSDMDTAFGAFDAYGAATAGLYVQGAGDSAATSRFELEVALAYDGRFVLGGDLSTTEVFGGFFPQDRPGIATVEVRLEDADTGVVHFAASTVFGAPGALLDGTVVPLAAGDYRLTVAAVALDATNGIEQIDGSQVAGVFDLQGRFEVDPPTTMFVEAIDVLALGGGAGRGKLTGIATVRVVNEAGEPVVGATVAGRFFGDLAGAARAVTDANGVATFVRTTRPPVGPPRFAFEVTGVAHGALAWDPTADLESVDTP